MKKKYLIEITSIDRHVWDRTTKNSHVRQAVTTAPSSTGREKRSSHLDSMKTGLRNAHLGFISSWNAGRQKTIEAASAVKQKEK
jgi:hypothetical protein